MENYTDPVYYENQFEENKRPGFLTFLCVLTFIVSGLMLLCYLIVPVFASTLVEMMRQSAPPAGTLEVYEQMAEMPIWHFCLLALLNATAILGAVYMLKMKTIGFHIYTVSKLVQLCVLQFLIGGSFQPKITGLIITCLFIGLYAIYYKKFTGLEKEEVVISD